MAGSPRPEPDTSLPGRGEYILAGPRSPRAVTGPAKTASPLRSGLDYTQVFAARWLLAEPVWARIARSTAMPAAAKLPAEQCPCHKRFRAQQTCAAPRCCPAEDRKSTRL